MPTLPHSLIQSLLPLTVLAACGGKSGISGDSYTITDSAGIPIIESLSPAWGEDGLRIDSLPFLRIGQEEEEPYQFGFVVHGLLLGNGQIAVAEASANEVRIFGSDGRHVTTLGGDGEGPGEFRSVAGLFEYRGDSLAVFDQRLYRTTIFPRPSGSPRTIPNQVEGNYLAFGVMRNGPFVLYNPGSGYRPDLPPGLQWDTSAIVAMDPSDGASRVITRLPSRQQIIEPDGNTRTLAPAHAALYAVADDGFYWATSDRYDIRFYDGDGSVRRIIRRPVQPEAVEPSMIEEYVEANLEWARRFMGEAALPRYRRIYAEATYGEHVPLFELAFVDNDQRLWVAAPVWPSIDPVPSRWSIFSEEGVWLGDVDAPEGVRIVDVRGDVALGLWQDEFDVPYVQLHRLIRE